MQPWRFTLERGCWNHDRFCRGVLSVEEAVVRGHLYEMPSGIPVLRIPEADILARGTADPLADVATCLRADTHRQAQARFSGHPASYLEPMPDKSAGQRIWTHQRCARRVRARDGEHQTATAGDWAPVYGKFLNNGSLVQSRYTAQESNSRKKLDESRRGSREIKESLQ